jgi:hypothetical protein
MTDQISVPGSPDADPAADFEGLRNLLTGVVVFQIVHAFAALRIADHIADGARTAEDIAEREHSDVRSTQHLMRAAAAQDLLRYEGDGRFSLTGEGTLLGSDVPGSQRNLALMWGGTAHWLTWRYFPEAVRTGTSQAEKALGRPIWEHLALPENAEEAAIVAGAMTGLTAIVLEGAVAGISTDDVSTAIDVGGSDGQFVMGLMEKDPGLRGSVLDLPHVIGHATDRAERLGLTDRFTAVGGDFLTEVPAADLYLLKTVLHDWPDEQSRTILRNCRRSATTGARAVVTETLVSEIGTPNDFATLSDMVMLGILGGMECDQEEWDALFAATGWRRTSTYPVGAGYFSMEVMAI